MLYFIPEFLRSDSGLRTNKLDGSTYVKEGGEELVSPLD